ncbi:MAG: SCO family protein [Gammaproteobacteria bacterium]|nr:SCO family protein [Gammaproteobacteria bacterium]
MTSVAKTVLLCLALVAVVLGMFVYSVTRPALLSAAELRDRGVIILPRPREIAGFKLADTRDGAFTVEDLRGAWTFVFFGFTNCPDICPTSMSVLAQAERQLQGSDPEGAEDFHGVLVTVDPERDDLETLGDYVEVFSPRFVGVAGALDETAGFARQLNVGFGKVPSESGEPGDYGVDHGAQIVIVNPSGHYHGFIKMPHRADTVAQAYKSLRANF